MRRLLLGMLICGAFAGLSTPVAAQLSVSLTFAQMSLNTSSRVNAIASDQTNRVWVATTSGVAALLGDTVAPGFPLNTNDFDDVTGGDANVLGVAFGLLSDGENFFLGFSNSVVYGRVISDRGVSFAPTVLGLKDPFRDLASDDTTALWVATNGGLFAYELGGAVPEEQSTVFRSGEAIYPIAVSTWVSVQLQGTTPDPAVVFFSEATERLYLARFGDSTSKNLANSGLSSVVGMDFEADTAANPLDGDLWIAGDRGGQRVVVRYPGEALKGPVPGDAQPVSFTVSALRAQIGIRDLAVDKVTGAVWLATSEGAYSQLPVDGTLADRDCTGNTDPACVGWRAAPLVPAERVDVAFGDPSGNLWFGTENGLSGILVRLLTLSSARYIGTGTQATATLDDLPSFANNGVAGESALLDVTVGSSKKTLTGTEEGDTGQFVVTFGFSTSAVPPDAPIFQVSGTSGEGGVPIQATYTYLGPEGEERFLTAVASWADEKPFEDDAFIGGPCFIRNLRY